MRCAICGRSSISSRYMLCPKCLSSLERYRTRDHQCTYCGVFLPQDINQCSRCESHEVQQDLQIRGCFYYKNMAKHLIQLYKFQGLKHLGYYLGDQLRKKLSNTFPNHLLVPIPPRPGKIFHTGWDQVKHLLDMNKIPYLNMLKRRKSAVQKRLNLEDRQGNMKGVFRISSSHRDVCPEQPILIVDDIVTTGSTLRDATRALRSHGCREIYALALALD